MLGERLAELIEGKSQAWLANELGVSRAAVCQWMSGASAPSDARLSAIARLFELSDADWRALVDLKAERCDP